MFQLYCYDFIIINKPMNNDELINKIKQLENNKRSKTYYKTYKNGEKKKRRC